MRRLVSTGRPSQPQQVRRNSLNTTRILKTNKLDESIEKKSMKQTLAKEVHELVNLLVDCEAAKNRAFKFDTPMIEHYKQKTAVLQAKLTKERDKNSRLMRRHNVISPQELHGKLSAKVNAMHARSTRPESTKSEPSPAFSSRVRELRKFNQELQQEIEFVKSHLAGEGIDALLET